MPWLIRHELRLAWRGIGGKGITVLLVLGLLLSLPLHYGAYRLLAYLPGGRLPDWAVLAAGAVVWASISLMLSQAMMLSVSALFERGDLDLLLSSPLPTRQVFMARALGIAASVVGLYLFLLLPLAHAGLFTGHASLLAIYPTLLALSLGVSALGLWLTLLLVRWLGARRARTVAQLLGSLVGAALFLASQAGNMLDSSTKQLWLARLEGLMAPGGLLSAQSPAWYPARAMMGEGLPLLLTVLVCVGGFWAVVGLAHRRYLAGTQESVTGSARRGMPARAAGSVRFGAGLVRITLLKEWRLILRDPQLIAQTLLQLLYLLPLLFISLRDGGRMQVLLVPVLVWLATALVANLAWITVSAEDAPDLLGGAPVPLRRLHGLKLLAALLPVWLLVLPSLVLAVQQDLRQALVLALCVLGGTVTVGAGQIAYPRQAKRSDLKARMTGHQVVGLLELLATVSWAGLAYCLLVAASYLAWPLAGVALSVGMNWWLGRARRELQPAL